MLTVKSNIPEERGEVTVYILFSEKKKALGVAGCFNDELDTEKKKG